MQHFSFIINFDEILITHKVSYNFSYEIMSNPHYFFKYYAIKKNHNIMTEFG